MIGVIAVVDEPEITVGTNLCSCSSRRITSPILAESSTGARASGCFDAESGEEAVGVPFCGLGRRGVAMFKPGVPADSLLVKRADAELRTADTVPVN